MDRIWHYTLVVAASILGFALASHIPALFRRLRTQTRTLYRRVIGMEHFEALVIDDLRIYRTDVDRFTRDTKRRHLELAHRVDALMTSQARLLRAEEELAEVNARIAGLEK